MTWGTLWAALGAVLAIVMSVVDPDSVDPGEGPLVAAAILGTVGFVSGTAFALIVSLLEDRKSILDLTLPRAALWGILGAAALPLLTGMNNSIALITCPLGAAFAAGSVWIARRAELRESVPPALPRPESQPRGLSPG